MASQTQVEEDELAPDEAKKEQPAAAPAPEKSGGLVKLLLTVGAVTTVAIGMGGGIGMWTAGKVAKAVVDQQAAQPVEQREVSVKYSGDMLLQPIDAVVTNLASPTETWIRLETAMVFKNGAVENPQVTAAELRQDILAYLRTVGLAQLEGPSALQHLREDLNERVALRTDNRVTELIVQTLVVQ